MGLSTLAMIPVAETNEKHKKKSSREHEHVSSEMVKAVEEDAANDLVVQDLHSNEGEE